MGNQILIFQEISFEEICEIWKRFLWPSRTSPIEPVSAINRNAEIDMAILSAKPRFFCAGDSNRKLGVVSIHPSESSWCRLRGLYVFEEFRKSGVGSFLVAEAVSAARIGGHRGIYGLIRQGNRTWFEAQEFQVQKFTEDYEFGPHFIMIKEM